MKNVQIILGAIMTLLPLLLTAEDAVLELECKVTKLGCVANFSVCYTAPDDLFIKESTMTSGTIEKYKGEEPFCGAYEVSAYVPFVISAVDPPIETKLPISFCAQMRIASTAGNEKIGTKAFLRCKYSFELAQVP